MTRQRVAVTEVKKMQDMKNLTKEVGESLKKISKDHPEFMKAFSAFSRETTKEGALDKKTKELIAVALAVKQECEWCIALHVKDALKAGATKEQIMESCFVATLMGGGPALMYTQLVQKAIEDFS